MMANSLKGDFPILSFQGDMGSNWSIFKTMHHNYCVLNDIYDDERKCCSMMNGIGAEGIKALNALDVPAADKYVYKKLIKHLDGLFSKKGNLIFDSFMFNKCDQKENQSYQDYFLELQQLAGKCEFKSLKNRLMRDRIVAGIRNDEHREKALLVNESAATLDGLQSYLIGLEATSRMSDKMSTAKGSCSEDVNRDEVFKLSLSRYENKEPRQERWPCPRCGEYHPSHARCQSSFRDATFENSPPAWSNHSHRPYGQRWNSNPRNRGLSRNNWRNDRRDENKRVYVLTAKETDEEIPMDRKMGDYDPDYECAQGNELAHGIKAV